MNYVQLEPYAQHIMTEDFFEYSHCRYGHPLTIDMHKQSFHGMLLLLEGSASYSLDGRTYQIHPGEALLIDSSDAFHPAVSMSAPLYEYIVLWIHDGFFNRLHINGDDLIACFRDILLQDCRLLRIDQTNLAKILSACGCIEQELSSSAFGNRIIAYSAVIDVIVLLNRAYFEAPEALHDDMTENELINQILLYINEHITEELTLEYIARQFYISSNYFSHQFKLFTGCSPYQYIMKKRLKLAYAMLSNGAKVSDAWEGCGFSDYSNFLKAFRREFSINPSDVRKQNSPAELQR